MVSMFSSLLSSERSIMWELNSGTPFALKNFSSSSSMPSNQGSSFLAQWSVCCRFENTKSVYVSHAFRIGTTHENNGDTVCGRNCADVVSTGDGSLDGSALVLVVDALSGEVCGTTLAHLLGRRVSLVRDHGPMAAQHTRMMGDLASRAASRDATTVEEEVTLIAGMAYPSDCACLKRL